MCVIAILEAEVRSSSVSVVYIVRLRIVFSKAALQKRGSMEPMEPPLDPPLVFLCSICSTCMSAIISGLVFKFMLTVCICLLQTG